MRPGGASTISKTKRRQAVILPDGSSIIGQGPAINGNIAFTNSEDVSKQMLILPSGKVYTGPKGAVYDGEIDDVGRAHGEGHMSMIEPSV